MWADLRHRPGDDADGRRGRRPSGDPGRSAARLPLDAHLSYAVIGTTAPVAHPGLVCDVADRTVDAGDPPRQGEPVLRGLVVYRFPVIGDTLFTRTEVVGLRQNSPKPGRAWTGLAALRMTTIDQLGRQVLDFYRCAMLPLRLGADPDRPDRADDLSTPSRTASHRLLLPSTHRAKIGLKRRFRCSTRSNPATRNRPDQRTEMRSNPISPRRRSCPPVSAKKLSQPQLE